MRTKPGRPGGNSSTSRTPDLSKEDRSEKLRAFFARLICAAAKVSDARIEQAFRTVRREPFVGPGRWSIGIGAHGYVTTPDDDPAFIYQNALVALDSARGINIGMPGAHAYWLDAFGLKEGETVLQIGAGSGYHTASTACWAWRPCPRL